MTIIRDRIPLADIAALAKAQFGDLVKAVVDVERGVMAVGGELHSDEEAMLLEDGSMINIRPSQGNRSRSIDDAERRKAVIAIVDRLVTK
jgi:hypothetical protein